MPSSTPEIGPAALGGRLFDSTFYDRHAGVASQCAHLGDCSIRPVLRHIQTAIDQVLGELTLQQLLCPEQEVRAFTSPRAVALPVVSAGA